MVTERDTIALEIEEIVSDVADRWGVSIEGILIKQVILSCTYMPLYANQPSTGE